MQAYLHYVVYNRIMQRQPNEYSMSTEEITELIPLTLWILQFTVTNFTFLLHVFVGFKLARNGFTLLIRRIHRICFGMTQKVFMITNSSTLASLVNNTSYRCIKTLIGIILENTVGVLPKYISAKPLYKFICLFIGWYKILGWLHKIFYYRISSNAKTLHDSKIR